jgi:Tfp pilus assembly protein PilF
LFDHGSKVSQDIITTQLRIALRDARKVVELQETDPENQLQLAFVYNVHGHQLKNNNYFRQSLKIVTKVLESRGISTLTRASAYSKRGVIFANLDEAEQAELDHNEALRLIPNDPAFLETRASFWEGQGRMDLAERDWAAGRAAREMNRNKPAATKGKDLRNGPIHEGPIQKPVQAPAPYITKEVPEPAAGGYGRLGG